MGVVFVAALAVNGVIMAVRFPRAGAARPASGAVRRALRRRRRTFSSWRRSAPRRPTAIAPAQYSQIIWAILLGALFFNEFPDATAFAGIALVTFAGLFTFVREEKRGARFPPVWTMVFGRGRDGAPAEA